MLQTSLLKRKSGLIEQIASDAVLEEAFQWLRQSRKDHPANSDVWDFRTHWHEIKPMLREELVNERYRPGPLRRFRSRDKIFELWSSRDALVLKAVTLVIQQVLIPRLSNACTHLAGKGGSKGAVRAVEGAMQNYEFVARKDVLKFYANIDHDILLRIIGENIRSPAIQKLLRRFLKRTIDDGGEYRTVEKGIPLGSPLSPLLGALYLKSLDERMEKLDLFYVRYMDDWVIMSKTRWKLKKAIRVMKDTMEELRLELHPEKTFVGRIAKGFDFLGYRLTRKGLRIAKKTIINYAERATRLKERGANEVRLGEYAKRWMIWVKSGVELSESVTSKLSIVVQDLLGQINSTVCSPMFVTTTC